jgi:hypothetical protein
VSDISGRLYGVFEYVGADPLPAGSPLNLNDTSRFRRFVAAANASRAIRYRYIGTEALRGVAPANLDFSDTSLWQLLPDDSTAPVDGSTANPILSLLPNAVIADHRANLRTDDRVLVESPAFFGLYRFLGPDGSLDLSRENYGDSSRWLALADGSAAATRTVANPGLLTTGTLITDPSQLVGVSLRRQTPLAVELTGALRASADGLRLTSASALTISGIEAHGLVSLVAPSLAQAANGTGISNGVGPIELRATQGSIGSTAAPLRVSTMGVASLSLESSADAAITSGADLILGSLRAAGSLSVHSSGLVRDGGRLSSGLGDSRANLSATTISLEAAGLGSVPSPLWIAGGSTLEANANGGAEGPVALRAIGASPVFISHLRAPGAPVWLSGGGTAGFRQAPTFAGAAIEAGSLVVAGLHQLGSEVQPLATTVASLSGAVGAGGLWLANSADLSIDRSADRSGTVLYDGLALAGSGQIGSAGALRLLGTLAQTSGGMNLVAAQGLTVAGSSRLDLASAADVRLAAGGLLRTQVGSMVNHQGGGRLELSGAGLVLAGVINTHGTLALNGNGAVIPLAP